MATPKKTTEEFVADLFLALKGKGWKKVEQSGGGIYWKVTMRKQINIGSNPRTLCIGCHTPDEPDQLHTPMWIDNGTDSAKETVVEFHHPTPIQVIVAAVEAYVDAWTEHLMPRAELFGMVAFPYEGRHYYATGKHGTDVETGQASAEFACEKGAGRVWMRQDGTVILD